jgi:ribonucleotide monophosphatase NagD (HAD superfamily)
MIGDNPASDIAGGNAKNMITILVKTGVFNPDAKTSVNGNDS